MGWTTFPTGQSLIFDALNDPRRLFVTVFREVRHGVLTTHALGPPGGEIHKLPEIAKDLGQLAAKPSGQSNEPSTLLWDFSVNPPRQS